MHMGETAIRLRMVSDRRVKGENSCVSAASKPPPPPDGFDRVPGAALPAAVAALHPMVRTDLEIDAAHAARRLLGAVLVRTHDGECAAVRLVETEAYRGGDDPGSHAFRGPTPRNRAMFGPPGCAYVYFTYGSHFMLNVVCAPNGQAGAVLLRGAEPVAGVDVMTRLRLRGRHVARPPRLDADQGPTPAYVRWLMAGPARLAAALGIDGADNGADMLGAVQSLPPRGFLLLAGTPARPADIGQSGRIGLAAGRGRDLRLRFWLKGSPGVSNARPDVP